MEHGRRTAVAQVVVPAAFGVGNVVTVDAAAAHHLHVLRLDVGARIALANGACLLGSGVIGDWPFRRRDGPSTPTRMIPRLPAVHMAVPVADREELWLAREVHRARRDH